MRRSAAPGFTVLETLVAVGLTGLVLMAITIAYSWSAKAHQAAIEQLPVAIARANLDNILDGAIRSAACIKKPAPGSSDDILIAYTSRDCADNDLTPPTAAGPQFFAFCLAGGLLLYAKGAGIPPTSFACSGSPASEVYTLTPIGVAARRLSPTAPIFARASATPNLVGVNIGLTLPAGLPEELTSSTTWQAMISTPGAL